MVLENSGRVLCYTCSKSEVAVRVLCYYERAETKAEILDQVFDSELLWSKRCRAERNHSTVMKHLYPLALFPETFSALAKVYADGVKKKLDKFLNLGKLSSSAENTDGR